MTAAKNQSRYELLYYKIMTKSKTASDARNTRAASDHKEGSFPMATPIIPDGEIPPADDLLSSIIETLPYTYAYNEPTGEEKRAKLEHARSISREKLRRFRKFNPQGSLAI